jgi:hypothetical protein
MNRILIFLTIAFTATSDADSLRLFVVSQKPLIPADGSPTKLDLFLYNDGSTARMVPSLEMFRATYVAYSFGNAANAEKNDMRSFSHPIKDHSLKAHGFDHTVIDVDISSEEGDYVELWIEIGDKPILRSNSLMLLCKKDGQ